MIESTSRLILNHEALKNNIEFLRSYIGRNVRISSVVKANAYGHGIDKFVPMAEKEGIRHFSVFSSEEAASVCRVKKPETRVMIMGWIYDGEIEWALQNKVEFYIFDISRLEKACQAASSLKVPARIHLELETGMNRTGLTKRELRKAVTFIHDHRECFEIKGICTHYAGAESIANYYRIQNQIRRFKRYVKWIREQGLEAETLHTASSAAALVYPNTRLDMVRIGIAQYGFWPSKETYLHYVHTTKDRSDPLQRIISWKSRIMSIKDVSEGEFVSYGTTYLAQSDKRIAIIPVGYANGFSRSLSNQGRVLIGGHRVAVIGMVNMNMLIADISQLPDAKPGDEVVLIGQQGSLEISVASFSEISDQLNYELLARLPDNISRKIIT
jgi:alanine racemase